MVGKICDQLEMGAEVDRETVKDYADFDNNFADKCHHGKEEDKLFGKMTDSGFRGSTAPSQSCWLTTLRDASRSRP